MSHPVLFTKMMTLQSKQSCLVPERMVIQSWQQAEQQTAVIDATNVSQQLLE
jgi:hypothetical protein